MNKKEGNTMKTIAASIFATVLAFSQLSRADDTTPLEQGQRIYGQITAVEAACRSVGVETSGLASLTSSVATAVSGVVDRSVDGEYRGTVTLRGVTPSLANPLRISNNRIDYVAPRITTLSGTYFSSSTAIRSFSAAELVVIYDRNGTSSGAFYNDTSLARIDCPNLETVGTGAFRGCSALTEVNAPSVSTVKDDAFSYSGVTEVTDRNFPSLKTIGPSAFAYCSSLAVVSNSTVSSFSGNSPFSNCTSLRYVCLPSLVSASASAFAYCPLIKEIRMDSLTSIPYFEFVPYASAGVVLYAPSVTALTGERCICGCTGGGKAYLGKVTSVNANCCGGVNNSDIYMDLTASEIMALQSTFNGLGAGTGTVFHGNDGNKIVYQGGAWTVTAE